MRESELDLRLEAVARALDAEAPAFDPAVLRGVPRRSARRPAVLAAVVALAGLAAVPAVSGLRDLFGVDEVPELGSVAPDVAPPLTGRRVPVDSLRDEATFRVRTITSLGAPDAAYVRDDIAGAMVTIAYDGGRILLTQWPERDASARIAVVPASGTAEETSIGSLPALWIEGTARGTFSVVGADGAVHRERFEVADGALLWQDEGLGFLLRGAGPRPNATRLAAAVR